MIPLGVNFEAKARVRQELHYVPGARHQLDNGETPTEENTERHPAKGLSFPLAKHYASAIPFGMNLKAKTRARQKFRIVPGVCHQHHNWEAPAEEKHRYPKYLIR